MKWVSLLCALRKVLICKNLIIFCKEQGDVSRPSGPTTKGQKGLAFLSLFAFGTCIHALGGWLRVFLRTMHLHDCSN